MYFYFPVDCCVWIKIAKRMDEIMIKPTHRPSLRFQAHWQNTQSQRYDQILPKSLSALPTQTHGQKDNAAKINDRFTNDKNGQLPTKCICHKGFSGYSIVVARSKFRVGGQETAPQSLTAHTLDRYKPARDFC